MRNLARGALVAVLVASGSALTAQAPAESPGASCAGLTRLTIPGVSIARAADVPAGLFSPPGGRPLTVDTFCRVEAVATPSADSSIRVEVWVPAREKWNGKLLGSGNG